jgi:hypothetical protein
MSMGGKAQSQTDQRLNNIQLTQSSYGNCVPLVYGETRISGSLMWYGNFRAIPHTEKQGGGGKGGGGGSSHTSFTYTAAIMVMLAEGQTWGMGAVWADKAITSFGALGLTVFNGATGQAAWSYLTTNFPAQAIPYDHTAYVASGALDLGGSAAIPNLSFELVGLLPFNTAGGIFDAEPGAILNDYCTDAQHGCGFPYLDATTLALYTDYCCAMSFFISPAEKAQRQAADFIKEILRITNSDCVWSGGKLKIYPYADQAVTGNGHTYTPNLSPLFAFTDDDYSPDEGTEPVRVTRKPIGDTFNIVRVEYSNRANQYNVDIAEAKDEQDIIVRGEKLMPTVKFPAITDLLVARQVAQLLLQRQLYVLNSYAFEVRADYCLLEPMDYVSLTDSGLGISNKLVRITSVDDSEEDRLSFEAEEVLVGTASAPVYNWQAAQGYAANYNATPGSVQAPFIFTGPPLLIDTGGGYEMWIAVAGPSGSGVWGGCDIYISVNGGSYYERIGQVLGGARYGTLTASLASGADPDTTHTLSVALNDTNRTLTASSTTEADNLVSLIYVDGEIMSYRDATLTGPGAYNLGYLRRGKYGSAIGAHLSGTRFVRLDSNLIRVPFDAGGIGQTVLFKFVSFNVFGGGIEDISTATAYSYTIPNNTSIYRAGNATLVARGSCIASGNTISKATSGSSAWDSDCRSIEAYLAGCAVSWRVPSTDFTLSIGVNADPTTDQSWTSLDYAIETDAGGSFSWNQSGVATSLGTYSAGDQFSVRYDGQWVRGYRNGVLVKEVSDPGKTFFMDSSFFTPGAVATDIDFGPLSAVTPSPFLARGRCKVSDSNAICQGGTIVRDADFYSIAGFPTCHITFKMNTPPSGTAPTTDPVVGLSTDPLANIGYPAVTYGFDVGNYGGGGAKTWQVLESGSAPGVTGTYTESTVFAITYDGATITYLVNAVSVRTVSVAGLTLFAKGSFAYPGEGINSLRFGPTTNLALIDTPQVGPHAATEVFQLDDLTTYTLSHASGSVYATPDLTFTAPESGDVVCTAMFEATSTSATNHIVAIAVLENGVQVNASQGQRGLDTTIMRASVQRLVVSVSKGSTIDVRLLVKHISSGTTAIQNTNLVAEFIKR